MFGLPLGEGICLYGFALEYSSIAAVLAFNVSAAAIALWHLNAFYIFNIRVTAKQG